MKLHLTRLKTASFELLVVCRDTTIVGVDFTEERLGGLLTRRFDRFGYCPSQLYAPEFEAYLAGYFGALDALPFDPGGTTFQQLVWRKLREIPVGETRTYTELAKAVGKEQAVRAVGRANALNPISLIIPCHRVVGRSGSLTGYGGGLEVKEWLLRHEAGGRL